jgi:hypothetical protein
LVDVLVVEDDLGAPGGRIVEIMLPASADDGAPVVPTEFGLLGGVRVKSAGLEKPFGKRLTVAQPGAAVSAVLQPCWNGFVWN